jgi:hypothetical protein
MYLRLEHHLMKEIDGFLEDESRDLASDILEDTTDIHSAMSDYEEDDISFRKFNPIGARGSAQMAR